MPQRIVPLLAPVSAAGICVVVAAAAQLFRTTPSTAVVSGIVALLLAAILTEAYPVPLESLPTGQVSLAAVFVVGTAVVYGWAEAAIVAFGARTTVELLQRRPLAQLLYNGPVYALAAGAAGASAAAIAVGPPTAALALEVLAASSSFYAVNVLLVTAMIARVDRVPLRPLIVAGAERTAIPFAIMASGSLTLAALWERSPLLSLALLGPLLAIALYQRSLHRALVATRLALTDALTGLGNQRHFNERLQHELDAAARGEHPVALCLLDVDGLKHVNDTQGHEAGDRLLERVAGCLRHGGEAFRVGGDEFALVLVGRDEEAALETARSVMARIAAIEVRVSAGLAVYPVHCAERSELYRAADSALYSSKREGKNEVHVYRPQPPRPKRKAS